MPWAAELEDEEGAAEDPDAPDAPEPDAVRVGAMAVGFGCWAPVNEPVNGPGRAEAEAP